MQEYLGEWGHLACVDGDLWKPDQGMLDARFGGAQQVPPSRVSDRSRAARPRRRGLIAWVRSCEAGPFGTADGTSAQAAGRRQR